MRNRTGSRSRPRGSVLPAAVLPSLLALLLISPVALPTAPAVLELPAAVLAAASDADLVPLVTEAGPVRTGRPATASTVVVNAGGSRAVGRVELALQDAGRPATGAAGDGWRCDSATGRCSADLDLQPGARSSPVSVTRTPDVAATGAPLTARLSTPLAQPTANDEATTSVLPVPDSDVDLAVRVRPRGPVVSGQEAVFDAEVLGLGRRAPDGPVTVRIGDGSATLGTLRAGGPGWTCAPEYQQLRCSTAAAPAGGRSLPPLEVGRRGPERSHRNDEGPAVGVAVGLEPVDAFGWNDRAVAASPVVPAGRGDLVLSAGADDAGGFAVRVSERGEGSAGPVQVRLTQQHGTATALGTGWLCSGTAPATCTHPGPVPPGGSLPVLRASTSGGGSLATLTSELVDPALPGSPETVTAVRTREDARLLVQQAEPGAPGGAASAVVRVRGDGAPAVVAGMVDAGPGTPPPPTTAAGSGWVCSSDLVCRHPGAVGDLPPLTLTTAVPAEEAAPVGWRVTALDEAGRDLRSAGAGASSARPPADLVVLATAGDPAPHDGVAATTVDVHNAGRSAAAGPTRVLLRGAGLVSASGEGWICTGHDAARACEHRTVVPAGGRLPRLTVLRSSSVLSFLLHEPVRAELQGSGVARLSGARAVATTPIAAVPHTLSVTLRPAEPLVAGRAAAGTAVVRNDGAAGAPGPVVLHLDAHRGGGRATGSGWSCEDWGRCTHPGPVPADGSLPPVQLSVVLPPDEGPGTGAVSARLVDPAVDHMVELASSWVGLPVVARSGPATVSVEVGGPEGVPLAPGAPATFPVEVRNPSSVDVAAPTVRITASSGLPLQVAQATGWSCTGTTCRAARGLAPGESTRLVLSGAADERAPSAVSVTAEVAAGSLTAATSRRWLVAGRGVDLVPLVNGRGAVAPGGRALFGVEVVNVGTDRAAAPVAVRLEASVGQAGGRPRASGAGWSCVLDICRSTAAVAPGARLPALSVEVPVDVYALGRTVDLRASLRSADDVEPADDTARGQVRVVAADAVDLSPEVRRLGPAAADGSTDHEVVVRNVGGVRHDVPVVVDLSGSPGVEVVGTPPAGWTCLLPAACRYEAPIEAAAGSPALRVRSGGGDLLTGVHVGTSSPQDRRTGNDAAYLHEPAVVRGGLDLALREAGPGRAVLEVATREQALERAVVRLAPAPVAASGPGWSCTPARHALECSWSGSSPARSRLPDLSVTPAAQPGVTTELTAHPVPDSVPSGSTTLRALPAERGQRTGPLLTADLAVNSPDGGRTGRASVTVRNIGTEPVSGRISVTLSAAAVPGRRAGPLDAAGTGWTCSDHDGGRACSTSATLAPGAVLPPLVATTRPEADPTPRVHGFSAYFSDDRGAFAGLGADGAVLGRPDAADPRVSVGVARPAVGGEIVQRVVDVENAGGRTTDGDVVVVVRASEEARPAVGRPEVEVLGGVTAQGPGWTCSGLTCRHGPLAAGGRAPLTVSVPVPTTGRSAEGTAVTVEAELRAEPPGPVARSSQGVARTQADPVLQLRAPEPAVLGRPAVVEADVVVGGSAGSLPSVEVTWPSHWPSRGAGTG
ncbi:MAG TPA: hypothetical protein VM433_14360, partial [Mycobacteriales bacterium]|nr:hypothetical protein [Mycobacteriales bacterium]